MSPSTYQQIFPWGLTPWKPVNNYVLLMMGGVGSRFGAEMPKQFTMIDDRPLFSYILKRLLELDFVAGVIVVTNASYMAFTFEWIRRLRLSVLAVVEGGGTRSESVFNGLKALRGIADSDDVVLMHDATHPYVDVEGTRRVADMVSLFGSATLASLNYDTTYRIDADNNVVSVIPRKEVVAGASPEGFRFGQIYDIYATTPKDEMEKMTSVGAIALAHGIPLKVVPSSVLNLKITYPGDMELFQELYKGYFFNEH